MPAPDKVHGLIERFNRELPTLKSGNYNETQVRIDFVNPLFRHLGWDIDNDKGFSQNYRDVIHEYSLATASGHKNPDYCFQIGGTPKFFLETKKPAVRIKDEIEPALQIRRYAWSAKLSLSILTDFEEFAVYDCRIKPKKHDQAHVARIAYYNYKEYLEKWDEIAEAFSKDGVLKGGFDKLVDSDAGKKGTNEVDQAFLADMEKWRELLAKNIALRNENLSQKDLNHLVQATLDRIIFLRICEDRKIEPYANLQKIATRNDKSASHAKIYPQLLKLFKQADDKYNSGLFHFKQENKRDTPDTLSFKLAIDDEPLQKIITQLYYPESPYIFSKIPAEILGQVYEKFLGKVIRLTKKHTAKVEEKPEVRKAGGVYYTPKYIVNYIVKNTIGELLKNKTLAQAKKLTILDPACGSGSFLLEAYQYLLDWYLKQYNLDKKKYKNKTIYKLANGDYTLMCQEKKEILLNNIYGVDIDRQAVEVSKLSLLLKVLEGESNETLQTQLFHERALPDLSNNIKCGNSLIGTDFFLKKNLELFDQDDMETINAFNWDSQGGFAEIMKNGGFDAVIGNPPYIQLQKFKGELVQEAMEAVEFSSHNARGDIYCLFYEKGVSLLKEKARLGFITSNKWMRAGYGINLRRYFIQNTNPLQILDFAGANFFAEATVDCNILILEKGKNKAKCLGYNFTEKISSSEAINTFFNKNKMLLSNLSESNWIIQDATSQNLKKKIEEIGTPLKDWNLKINFGIKTGYNEAFIIDKAKRNELIKADPKSAEIIKPILRGKDIKAYHHQWAGLWVILAKYQSHLYLKNEYPAIYKYLSQYKDRLENRGQCRYGGKNNKGQHHWLELDNNPSDNYLAEFEKEKIIYSEIVREPQFYFDKKTYYAEATSFIMTGENLKFLLGLLHSKLITYTFKTFYAGGGLGGQGYRYKKAFLNHLPAYRIDLSNKNQKAQHDAMVQLVEQMLSAQKNLSAIKSEADKKHYQNIVTLINKKIDVLVYKLYKLRSDEIKIVEKAT